MNFELECTVSVVLRRYNKLSKKASEQDSKSISKLIKKVSDSTVNNYTESQIEDMIEEHLENRKYNVRSINNLPVKNENMDRLSFKNPNSNIIHIASEESHPSDTKLPPSYTWSLCHFGSSRGKTKENAFYLDETDVENGYVKRDGEIIGKICGHCQKIIL